MGLQCRLCLSSKAFAATSAAGGKVQSRLQHQASCYTSHENCTDRNCLRLLKLVKDSTQKASQAVMEGGRIDPDRMDDSDSENTISDAKSISENDTFDENHRLGVQNLRWQQSSLLLMSSIRPISFLFQPNLSSASPDYWQV